MWTILIISWFLLVISLYYNVKHTLGALKCRKAIDEILSVLKDETLAFSQQSEMLRNLRERRAKG